MRRFAPGGSVALREIWAGRIRAARAATVVQDADDQLTLFVPAGAPSMRAFRDGRLERRRDAPYELAPALYDQAHVLSFAWPQVSYAILGFFHPDWRFWNWYVNLQDPLHRTPIGFDTRDHVLDVIVEHDGTWRWKDEDELALAIAHGLIPAADEARLRAEGERAVRRIVEHEPPFDRDWTTWRSDPAWNAPTLPEGWDELRP